MNKHDGIVHRSLHEGTNNVDDRSALAAWHERSAVHRALEEATGDKWGEADVAKHVQVIRRMSGPDKDKYERAAKLLPDLVKTSGERGTLYSSASGSRPYGPRFNALTDLVRPLVHTANRHLARLGMTRPASPAPAPEKGEAGKKEDARWETENTPEKLPEPKKAIDEPIKVDKRRTVGAGKAREAAEARENEQPVIDNEQPAIPLAPDPRVKGGRFTFIHELTKNGHDAQSVLQQLQSVHGLTPRQAKDTLRRWARSEDVRRLMWRDGHEGEKAQHLARPVVEKVVGLDELSKTGVIGGTALEYHLKHLMKNGDAAVSNAARLALKYDKDRDLRDARDLLNAPDPYAYLGKLLGAAKHKLAEAYNWHTMKDSLDRDRKVEQLFSSSRARFKGGDRAFWDVMVKQMRDPKRAQVWDAVLKRLPGHSREQVEDSIHRIADRHLDREYLEAVRQDVAARTKATRAVTGSPMLPSAHSAAEEAAEARDDVAGSPATDLHWRTVAGRVPGKSALKFARGLHPDEFAEHDALVHTASEEPSGLAPLGDWLEEHEHPNARLIQAAATREPIDPVAFTIDHYQGNLRRGTEMWQNPQGEVHHTPAWSNGYAESHSYEPIVLPGGKSIIRTLHRPEQLREVPGLNFKYRSPVYVFTPVKSRADLDYLTEHLHPDIRHHLHAHLDAHLPKDHES